jgi:NADH pyrophosphatase NudC (nudix superfamily)
MIRWIQLCPKKYGAKILSTRSCSSDSNYVSRVRQMDYWQQSDHALEAEFDRGKFALMVDKEPLVVKAADSESLYTPDLAICSYDELKTKLQDYGLEIGMLNSVLLDVLDPTEDYNDFRPLFGCAVRTMMPPVESGISITNIRQELGSSLGGQFLNLRMAMLTLRSESHRNLLARFQALYRWHMIYRRCPTCASPLKAHASKMSAICVKCSRVYYPTISPVAICLVTDPSNDYCLLVRHRGSVGSVFTCVAGFSIAGESLQETARREIAEEVGIVAYDIKALNMSQPWPMPNSSLMTAFRAVANMKDKIEIAPDELERAEWFPRDHVRKALDRVLADPNLRGAKADKYDIETRQILRFIPPAGAIAHHIIKQWVLEK